MVIDAKDKLTASGRARNRIRDGVFTGQTAGLAPGYVQGNVVILPADWADSFLLYCLRNPKACPLLAVSEPGSPFLSNLGDVDIRTDVPRYRIFHDGELQDKKTDITALWRDDLVAFALGCSFSFEEALLEEGIPLRHLENDQVVPMFETGIETTPAGPFQGKLVLSMRPLRPADAIRAIQITSRYPTVHGAPVHFGDPSLIGIERLNDPDWGDSTEIRHDETPVFWACGVTPQVAIRAARPPFCITHEPGHMLVTDLKNSQLAVL
jgi:uncharacterized protein YcsI (UPF0317 family)